MHICYGKREEYNLRMANWWLTSLQAVDHNNEATRNEGRDDTLHIKYQEVNFFITWCPFLTCLWCVGLSYTQAKTLIFFGNVCLSNRVKLTEMFFWGFHKFFNVKHPQVSSFEVLISSVMSNPLLESVLWRLKILGSPNCLNSL